MEFNQHLKKLREDENLTQEQLALKLNVSRSAIAKWEQGKGMPSLDLLKSLALFFHTSIDALLGEEGIRRLEKNQNRKFKLTSLVAVTSLVIATLSTTLLLLKNDVKETKKVLIESVYRSGDSYKISYLEKGRERKFSADVSAVSFRNQPELPVILNENDYLKVDLIGNRATKVVLIDNSSALSLKGYEIEFSLSDNVQNYFFHEYLNTKGDFDFIANDTNIVSFDNSHFAFSSHHYDGVKYQHTQITQTIAIDQDASTYNFIKLKDVYIDKNQEDTIKQTTGNYIAGLLLNLNFSMTGYLNSYAYESEEYSLRNLVSYDVSLSFVKTIETVRIKEFSESNVELKETSLSYLNVSSFETGNNTSYLRYYIGDSNKGKTVEVGDQEKLYLKSDTPLPSLLILEI